MFPSHPIIHIANNSSLSNENLFNLIIAGSLGIAGTLLGVLITEYFKRKDRVSLYAEAVFKKKLDTYEVLYSQLQEAYGVADTLFFDKKMSVAKKKEIWETLSLKIADYCDKHSLYLNEDVVIHCIGSLVGVDDYLEMPEAKRTKELKKYYEDRKTSYALIKEDSGLKRLDLFFKVVNKPKITSSLIEYMNELRKKQKK